MSQEQKLIDICFELVLTITSTHPDMKDTAKIFSEKTNEEKAKWVSDKFRTCGFDTEPCGASWGVLKK